jgi:hypothetical protein
MTKEIIKTIFMLIGIGIIYFIGFYITGWLTILILFIFNIIPTIDYSFWTILLIGFIIDMVIKLIKYKIKGGNENE